MLRDVWVDEKPTGPSSLKVYMLLVRPSPLVEKAKATHIQALSLSFHLRHSLSPKPIPPSPLRFCTRRCCIPQTGNFHTPSAHRHQNSRSACSPPPRIHPSAFRPRCGAQICHQKTGPLGWREISSELTIGHSDSWCRGFYGNARLAGAQGGFRRFGGASLGVVRQKGLAKACFFPGSRRGGGWRRGGIGARGWGACAMQRALDGAGSDLDGMG